MSGFLGCDTAQMQQLAGRCETASAGLETWAEVLDAAGDLRWEGPDAQAFRAAGVHVGRLLHARAAALRSLADDLRAQADEQDRASSAEGPGAASGGGAADRSAVDGGAADGRSADGGARIGPDTEDGLDLGAMARNGPLGLFGDSGGLSEDDLHDLVEPHPLGYGDPETMSRWAHRTARTVGRRLFEFATRPVPEWLDPGKPFAHRPSEGLVEAVRERAAALDAPVRPHDPSFDLDPAYEQHGSHLRHALLAGVPVAGEVQAALDARERVESARSGLEAFASEHGLGEETTPLFATLRIAHGPDEALLGRDSSVGSMVSGADRLLGSGLQTTAEVSGALGQGDLAGAARAMETGSYRGIGIAAHTATTTPVSAFGPMVSTQLGAEAAILDSPIFQGTGITGDDVRAQQEAVDAFTEDFERRRKNLTDTEPLLEMRRRVAPMPWDA